MAMWCCKDSNTLAADVNDLDVEASASRPEDIQSLGPKVCDRVRTEAREEHRK